MRYLWIIMLVLADCFWIGITVMDIYDGVHIMKDDFDIWDLDDSSVTCIGLHILALFLISLISWFKYKFFAGG